MTQSKAPALYILAIALFSQGAVAAPPNASGSPSSTVAPLQAEQGVKRVQQFVLPSVVRLQVYSKDGSSAGKLTGIVVGDGLVATNFFWTIGTHTMTAFYANGHSAPVVGMAAFDAKHYLALLRVPTLGVRPVPLEETVSIKPGDPAFAVGDPNSPIIFASFQRVRQEGNSHVLEIAGDVSPYSFGASFLDVDGRIIGLMSLPSTTTPEVTFAYPAYYLKRLIVHPLPQTMTWREIEKQMDQSIPRQH